MQDIVDNAKKFKINVNIVFFLNSPKAFNFPEWDVMYQFGMKNTMPK